jgi:hypothetical protein
MAPILIGLNHLPNQEQLRHRQPIKQMFGHVVPEHTFVRKRQRGVER